DVQFQKERKNTRESSIFFCLTQASISTVLDEADRILDLGFKEQINAVVQNLPENRQTLLFSATQTRSVKDLARLSLKDPVYVSVNEHSEYSTPMKLQQSYMVCKEHEKIDLLWSFLRNHLHSRIIIFFSNCKQVRFVYEAFRRLRPGLTVLSLHGSMNQMKRVNVYEEFCSKQHAALFATDVAARGLDFPNVDWVYQFDCPQDATEYIHRSGRTARYSKEGESLLILTPNQEAPMLKELSDKKVPIRKINVNRKKLFSVRKKLEILCAKDTNFKLYVHRAFVAYMRSLVTMTNKAIFDVSKIDGEALARSYGLAIAPRIRFLRKMNEGKSNSNGDDKTLNKGDYRKNDFSSFSLAINSDDDGMDDIFVVKRKDVEVNVKHQDDLDTPVAKLAEPGNNSQENFLSSKRGKRLTKSKIMSKLLKKDIRLNNKTVFDDNDDGDSVVKVKCNEGQYSKESTKLLLYDIEEAKRRMAEADKVDKENYRSRVKAKHREKRLAKKARNKGDIEENDGNDKFDSEDDNRSVDLSWIPDYDKINAEQSNLDDVEQRRNNPTEEEEESEPNPKRSRKSEKSKGKQKVDEDLVLALLEN
uniref:ATP-dependent RNA helicase n=1 Tax=Romanomermis culicivorax TaxID=13658 RepID=A0A915KRN2_ROMCU